MAVSSHTSHRQKYRRGLSLFLLLAFAFALTGAGTPTLAKEALPRRAVLTALEGAVLLQAAGQATAVPARKNMELKSGDRIITGKDGSCTVRYDGGSTTRIGPDSRVDFTHLSRQGADGPETTVLSTQRGTVWNNAKDVVARNSRFEVNTPAAVAGVRGTFWKSVVLSNGDTLFIVLGGGLFVLPAAELADDADGVEAPAPPEQGIMVEGGQQLGVITGEELPESAVPLDYDELDNLTLMYLAEDNPAIFMEVVNEAANQGKAEFLQRVENLLAQNQELQQFLGEQLPQLLSQLTQALPPAFSPPPADGGDDAFWGSISLNILEGQVLLVPKGYTGKAVFSLSPFQAELVAVSSNPGVAAVAVGTYGSYKTVSVTGVGAGTATVTVTASLSGYSSASVGFTVTVVELDTSQPPLSCEPMYLPVGYEFEDSEITIDNADPPLWAEGDALRLLVLRELGQSGNMEYMGIVVTAHEVEACCLRFYLPTGLPEGYYIFLIINAQDQPIGLAEIEVSSSYLP